jgi:hypothetical protein
VYPLDGFKLYREIGVLQRVAATFDKVGDSLIESLANVGASKAKAGAAELNLLTKKAQTS